ncbi:hypothetical protein HYH03_001636 [Edaphochlamys debaryana]|uniref:Uncharacterized protein n=1 Tax=Edaphochlamys debaryana TaxID=47281 RepID=A0A836C554_9CHLO|nr:hypothetical protein HYH03_001636 [Edaphochlamys debaryana]|eukprot:KAG2500876.1 hypothetical protein HYH03_001636 [Edaphochlamys debaryana]
MLLSRATTGVGELARRPALLSSAIAAPVVASPARCELFAKLQRQRGQFFSCLAAYNDGALGSNYHASRDLEATLPLFDALQTVQADAHAAGVFLTRLASSETDEPPLSLEELLSAARIAGSVGFALPPAATAQLQRLLAPPPAAASAAAAATADPLLAAYGHLPSLLELLMGLGVTPSLEWTDYALRAWLSRRAAFATPADASAPDAGSSPYAAAPFPGAIGATVEGPLSVADVRSVALLLDVLHGRMPHADVEPPPYSRTALVTSGGAPAAAVGVAAEQGGADGSGSAACLQQWLDALLTAALDGGGLAEADQREELYGMLPSLATAPSSAVVERLYAEAWVPAAAAAAAAAAAEAAARAGLSRGWAVVPAGAGPSAEAIAGMLWLHAASGARLPEAALRSELAALEAALFPGGEGARWRFGSASASPGPGALLRGPGDGSAADAAAAAAALTAAFALPSAPGSNPADAPGGGASGAGARRRPPPPPPVPRPARPLTPRAAYLCCWALHHHKHVFAPAAAKRVGSKLLAACVLGVRELSPRQRMRVLRCMLLSFGAAPEVLAGADWGPLTAGWEALSGGELLAALRDVAVAARLRRAGWPLRVGGGDGGGGGWDPTAAEYFGGGVMHAGGGGDAGAMAAAALEWADMEEDVCAGLWGGGGGGAADDDAAPNSSSSSTSSSPAAASFRASGARQARSGPLGPGVGLADLATHILSLPRWEARLEGLPLPALAGSCASLVAVLAAEAEARAEADGGAAQAAGVARLDANAQATVAAWLAWVQPLLSDGVKRSTGDWGAAGRGLARVASSVQQGGGGAASGYRSYNWTSDRPASGTGSGSGSGARQEAAAPQVAAVRAWESWASTSSPLTPASNDSSSPSWSPRSGPASPPNSGAASSSSAQRAASDIYGRLASAAAAAVAPPPAPAAPPLTAAALSATLSALRCTAAALDPRLYGSLHRGLMWALQRLGARAGRCLPGPEPAALARVPELMLRVQSLGWVEAPLEWARAVTDRPSTGTGTGAGAKAGGWFRELSWGEALRATLAAGRLVAHARAEVLRRHGAELLTATVDGYDDATATVGDGSDRGAEWSGSAAAEEAVTDVPAAAASAAPPAAAASERSHASQLAAAAAELRSHLVQLLTARAKSSTAQELRQAAMSYQRYGITGTSYDREVVGALLQGVRARSLAVLLGAGDPGLESEALFEAVYGLEVAVLAQWAPIEQVEELFEGLRE